MKKKLIGIFVAFSFIFIFAVGASASSYVQRLSFGYAYNDIGDLSKSLSPDFDLSKHNFYMENASLFEINAVPNLYIGFKNNFSFSLDAKDYEQALVRHTSLLLTVEYDYAIKNSNFSIGGAFNAGFNAVSLVIREFNSESTLGEIIATRDYNYINIWRPYFVVGGSVNAVYQINSWIQVNLNAGALYNIGVGEWLDLFDKIEGSSEILPAFLTVFASVGVGFSF